MSRLVHAKDVRITIDGVTLTNVHFASVLEMGTSQAGAYRTAAERRRFVGWNPGAVTRTLAAQQSMRRPR